MAGNFWDDPRTACACVFWSYIVIIVMCYMFMWQDSDVHVTYEDQQKINLFARTNARLQDLKEELDVKKVYLYSIV